MTAGQEYLSFAITPQEKYLFTVIILKADCRNKYSEHYSARPHTDCERESESEKSAVVSRTPRYYPVRRDSPHSSNKRGSGQWRREKYYYSKARPKPSKVRGRSLPCTFFCPHPRARGTQVAARPPHARNLACPSPPLCDCEPISFLLSAPALGTPRAPCGPPSTSGHRFFPRALVTPSRRCPSRVRDR